MHDTISASAASNATPRRILVVDDSIDGAQAMALLLECDGHDARVAHDGRTAVAEAHDFQPEVVFLDIRLPDMDGYQVARALRSDPAIGNAVLVALTGWGTEEDRRKSVEAGFDHHFVKPVDLQVIESMLRSLDQPSAPH